MALTYEVNGVGAIVGRNHLITFLFQKHDMGLQEINLVVCPKDCRFVHSSSNLYRKREKLIFVLKRKTFLVGFKKAYIPAHAQTCAGMTCFLKADYTILYAQPSIDSFYRTCPRWNDIEGRVFVLHPTNKIIEKSITFAAKFIANGDLP